jgi:hypothetical protein
MSSAARVFCRVVAFSLASMAVLTACTLVAPSDAELVRPERNAGSGAAGGAGGSTGSSEGGTNTAGSGAATAGSGAAGGVVGAGAAGGGGAEDASSDAGASGGGSAGSGGGSAGSGGQAGNGTGGSSGASSSYASVVLSDNPSLYWRELGGTGSIVDVSLMGNHGTYSGCVEPGAIGAGATIRLCGGYLYTGDIFDFADRAPFTFEAWIRPEALQPSRFARIVSKENPVAGQRQGWDLLLIGWEQDGGMPALAFERWHLVDGAATGSGVFLANPEISSVGFTHVAITYDSETCRIYLNGVSAMEEPNTASIVATSGTFRVGANAFGQNWHGDIDEIAVYERALLPHRVAAHYDRGTIERR